MERSLLVIILLLSGTSSFSQDKDTLDKENKYFVHYYPSLLLSGDIAFGLEHCYKTRFAHEISIAVKCFDPPPFIYQFNKGFRTTYFLKYNLVNRKYFRFSPMLSFFYRDISFKNKMEYWGSGSYLLDVASKFLMDKRRQDFGGGLGFSFNFRVAKKIFIGSDYAFYILRTKQSYVVKEGPVSFYDPPLPYAYSDTKFRRGYYDFYMTIKLTYLINS